MRRLNVRLFVILLVSVGLGAALIQGVHAIQVRRHAGAFLREADRAEKEGKRREATDDLRKYLLLNPDDTKTTLRLGNLLFDQARDHEAQTVLGQVAQREPNNDDVRRRLVEISLRQRRYQDARYQLKEYLLKSHAEEGQLYFQLGTCDQALGEFDAAAAAFRQAIAKKPDLLTAYDRLAGLLADRLENGAQAATLLNEMIARNPNASKAYVLRGAFLQSHSGQPMVQAAVLGADKMKNAQPRRDVLARSFADAKRALELAPNDSETLVLAAESAFVNGLSKEATEFSERLIATDPKVPASYFVVAQLDLRAGKQKEAAARLARGLEATAGDPLLTWTLAALDIDTNNIAEARKLVDKLRGTPAARPIVQYLEARILITESKWDEASKRLTGLAGDLHPWPQFQKESLLWLAQCHERLRHDEQRLEAYRAALEIDPQWVPARLGLADALRAQGHTEDALLEYQRLPQKADAGGVNSLRLVRLAILANLSKPREPQVWKSIDEQLDRAAKDQPPGGVALLRTEIRMAQGKADEARQVLREAIKREPKDPLLWNALVAIAARQKKWDEVEQLLKDASAHVGDGISTVNTLIR